MNPRTFELVRHRDPSGVSGTGVVAEGCVFTDGSVALRWRGTNPATAVWPDLESVLAVHGHQGATQVRWLDDAVPRTAAGGATGYEVPPAQNGEVAAYEERARRLEPRPAPRHEAENGGSVADELVHLLPVQHAVRPPGSVGEPAGPGGRARGWAGARHLR